MKKWKVGFLFFIEYDTLITRKKGGNDMNVIDRFLKYVAVDTLNDRFGEGTIIPAKLLEQSKMPSPRKVEIRMPRGMI